MRHKLCILFLVTLFLSTQVAFAGVNFCYQLFDLGQQCFISEEYGFDQVPFYEPPVLLQSFRGADLQVGYVPLWEFGSTPDNAIISDYLVFPDSGNGYADSMILYSADNFDQFPPGILSGLSPITIYDLGDPSTPLWGRVEPLHIYDCCRGVAIWEGRYFDAFIVFSDPTPEPSSILLLATGTLGMAGVLRRKLF